MMDNAEDEWLEKQLALADRGDHAAMARIAKWNFERNSANSNIAVAMQWLRRAQDSSNPQILVVLGELLEKHVRDCNEAERLYEKAATISPLMGNYMLGRLYVNRLRAGCRNDYQKAYNYFTKSSLAGHIPSKIESARLLRAGVRGVLGKYVGYPMQFLWCTVISLLALSSKQVSEKFWRYTDIFAPNTKFYQRLKYLVPDEFSLPPHTPVR